MKDLARHLLLELYDCDAGILNDADTIQRLMVQAANRLRTTILEIFWHRFTPQGVTVAVIIAESHLTVHTWPEHGYAAVDVFTCGDTSTFDEIAAFLTDGFRAGRVVTYDHPRGPRVPEPAYAVSAAAGDRSEDLR